MATLEKRLEALEERDGQGKNNGATVHVIEDHTFDVGEDTEPFERAYAEVHGIDLADGRQHFFVTFYRPAGEAE